MYPKTAIQPYVYKTQPYPHQHECFERSRDMEAFGILFEMGAGKSKVIVDTSAYLHSHGKIEAVLLIAPNGVHRKWMEEDFPFSFPDWAQYKGAVWQASSKPSLVECENLFKPGSHLRVLCMNVEGFSGKSGVEMAKKFLNTFDCMIVIDESSRIKNPTAIRTKTLLKLSDKAKYRRILTGTYISNSPFDAYSQFMFLDPEIFGQSFFAFKAEYAEIMDKNSPIVQAIQKKSGSRFAPMLVAKDKDGKPLYRNLDKLKSLIAPHSMRVTKEECLSLPPKIYEKRHFSLAATQQRIYNQLRDESKTALLDDKLTILHKMTLILRLQQVSSGYMPNDEGELIQIFDKPSDNPRIKTLVDTLEDIEGSVIIWCRFVEEIRQLSEVLGDEAICYYGAISQEGRRDALEEFKSNKKRIFLGNVATGGIGLNLTQATTVIYYSNTFSYEDRKQSEDRAHRIGQTADKVLYIDLQAQNTVDSKIIAALLLKENLATYMNDLKNCQL
jgi:hypothetical protein